MAALALAAAACGETSDADPTPVLTPPLTPASGTPRATATAAASPTAAPRPAGTPSDGGGAQAFTIVGANVIFDVKTIEAKAGTITFIFENKDGGVPHNIAFYRGSDATGEVVGKTEIKNGPATDTIALEFEAGSYFYQCDVHPATMDGTMTVS